MSKQDVSRLVTVSDNKLQQRGTVLALKNKSRVIGEFLGEDIYAYSNDTTLLEEKIFLLTNVDFNLSNDNRLITLMQHDPDKQISQDAALSDDQDSSKQDDDTQIPEQEFLMADYNSSY
ncbi:hypothetical protein ACROYT_G015440 [Oculina patagonica]